MKVAKKFIVILEAFFNESVPETGDQVHSYACVPLLNMPCNRCPAGNIVQN